MSSYFQASTFHENDLFLFKTRYTQNCQRALQAQVELGSQMEKDGVEMEAEWVRYLMTLSAPIFFEKPL